MQRSLQQDVRKKRGKQRLDLPTDKTHRRSNVLVPLQRLHTLYSATLLDSASKPGYFTFGHRLWAVFTVYASVSATDLPTRKDHFKPHLNASGGTWRFSNQRVFTGCVWLRRRCICVHRRLHKTVKSSRWIPIRPLSKNRSPVGRQSDDPCATIKCNRRKPSQISWNHLVDKLGKPKIRRV
jgi:hypothetical protein